MGRCSKNNEPPIVGCVWNPFENNRIPGKQIFILKI
jgi:hypothetical protein